MKSIITYTIIAYSIFSTGCIDTVEYNLSKEFDRLIISGQFTDQYGIQEIRVSKSVLLDKDAKVEEEVISNAEVSILHNNELIQFTYFENGVYRALSNGISGESYKLKVLVNGQVYESTFETMPKKPTLATPRTKIVQLETLTSAGNIVREDRIQLNASGTISNDEYFLFRTTGEYEFKEFNPMSTTNKSCYIPSGLDQGDVNIISADRLKANVFDGYPILLTLPDDKFLTNFCFHIRQFNINAKAYAYWSKVDEVLSTGNGLFKAPPGKLFGNIKNINDDTEEVLGYFTLGGERDFKHFTNTTKLRILVKDPCGFIFNQPRPKECDQCLIIPQSTSIKPSYWP